MATTLTITNSHSLNVHQCSILPPATGERHTRNVVIAYDRSGSMGIAANPDGDEIAKLYSKNDLAKRAAEIVARSLLPDDTLTIITYNDTTKVELRDTKMDVDGLKNALTAINKIVPEGGTAIWKGLSLALDIANNYTDSTVILITDGEPSQSPAEGEEKALFNYRIAKKNRSRLYTVGIGYGIKSELLSNLANVGDCGGSFIFIPDHTMVIPAFVNLIANERVVYGRELTVRIVGKNAGSVLKVQGEYPMKMGYNDSNSEYVEVSLGTIKYGQSRDFCMTIPTNIELNSWAINASYIPTNATQPITISVGRTVVDPLGHTVVYDYSRCLGIAAMCTAIRKGALGAETAKRAVIDAVGTICKQTAGRNIDEEKIDILRELEGEVAMGLSTDVAWTKWGSHYLRGIVCAHRFQICTNHKDKGLQNYGGEMFNDVKNAINSMANELEPPTPSLTGPTYNSYSYYSPNSGATNAPVITREVFSQRFNSADDGGCFGPNSLVQLFDGTTKKTIDIRAGDIVKTKDNTSAKVICVVEFENVRTVKLFGKLDITPWHPVFVDNRWSFPSELLTNPEYTQNSLVYNFILDTGHTMVINDIIVCTLGHNITGPVIGHNFYGTNVVTFDLSRFPDYNSGRVRLNRNNHIYNDDGVVSGYKVI